MMQRAEFHRHVGAENILPSVDAALRRARQVRDANPTTKPSPHVA